MTIYKNLDWEKLSDRLDDFGMGANNTRPCKINGLVIYCDRIDVYPIAICFYNDMDTGCMTCSHDDYWTQDVAKVEFKEGQMFDLIIEWDCFEVKLST